MFGKQYGNVFIGVQPTFGYEGDPMRLLFSRSASPHHGFAAYYTFLERIFKACAGPRTCVRCCVGISAWRRLIQVSPLPCCQHANLALWLSCQRGCGLAMP